MVESFKDKIAYLDYLYYKINNQQPMILQWQQQKPERMSKRKSYEELCFDKDLPKNKWWLDHINARNILLTEICLDYDPFKGICRQDILDNLTQIKCCCMAYMKLSSISCDIKIFDTTSNGIHVHIFDENMKYLSYDDRCKHRLNVFRQMGIWIDNKKLYPENGKYSEHVTINLEYAKHWKTGKIKECIWEI